MSPARRRIVALGLVLPAMLALGAIVSSNWMTGLLFEPKLGCDPPPAEAAPCTVVRIPTAAGRMEGWLFPAKLPPGQPPRAVVVHAHGNGWNLEKQWRPARDLAQRGFDVVAFDYRGFGNSEGRATRRSTVEDIGWAIAWAHGWARTRGEAPVALLGQSMGATLSIEVGARRPDVVAIIADSPFDSWAGVAAANLADARWARAVLAMPLALLFRPSGPDPADVVADVRVPLLIITGTADRVCPPEMSRDLASVSRCRLLEIQGAAHVGRRTPEQAKLAEDTEVAFLDAAIGDGSGGP